jgi:hypothetical protein
MMTEASSANLELAIVLPLGVVVNQLMRAEAHLRLLNMKTMEYAKECSNARFAGPIVSRLEQIHDTLDSIRGLVADIEADVRPRSADAARSSTEEDTSQLATDPPSDDECSSLDMVHMKHSNRKSHADWDD